MPISISTKSASAGLSAIAEGEVVRGNRHGHEKTQTLWSRVPPALQLPQVFRAAVGREMQRTRIGGIAIKRELRYGRQPKTFNFGS
jgi:hypothetical protein